MCKPRARPSHLTRALSGVTVFALGLVGGCGAAEEPPTAVQFVGEVPGTDALIGIVVGGDGRSDWAAYVCGGPMTLASHTRWYAGGPTELVKDGWKIDGMQETGDTMTARLVPPVSFGSPVEVTLLRADSVSAPAGIYTTTDGECRLGAIVLTAGGPAKLQGTRCYLNGVAQVTPLQPLVMTSEGLRVRVNVRGAVQDFGLFPLGASDL